MKCAQENVIQLLPQAPEPLTADEINSQRMSCRHLPATHGQSRALSQRPTSGRSCADGRDRPRALNRLELKMRVDMKAANAPDADAEKFNFKPIRDEAKQNPRERATRIKNIAARRRHNARTQSARRTQSLGVATCPPTPRPTTSARARC